MMTVGDKNPILIIGAADEPHAAYIFERLEALGESPVYFDTRRFPTQMKLAFYPGEAQNGHLQVDNKSPSIPLNAVQSVYWRYHFGIELSPSITDSFIREMAFREIDSAIGALFRSLPCLWVNSAEAIEQHRYKGFQLKLLAEAGLRIPDTLISNDPEAVKGFYHRYNGKVIYKPVRGGAHTSPVKKDDIKPDRLKELSKSPVQFQEMIPGVDIRVYFINGETFAAEIQSQTLDFRDDPRAPIVPIELPETVQAACVHVAEELGLLFSGIDLRRTPEQEYVFIEGNPSPMFLHFQEVTGYPIGARLIDLLRNPDSLKRSKP